MVGHRLRSSRVIGADRRRIRLGTALDRIVDDAQRCAAAGDRGVDPNGEVFVASCRFPPAGAPESPESPKPKVSLKIGEPTMLRTRRPPRERAPKSRETAEGCALRLLWIQISQRS
jgi:hypothetical protein